MEEGTDDEWVYLEVVALNDYEIDERKRRIYLQNEAQKSVCCLYQQQNIKGWDLWRWAGLTLIVLLGQVLITYSTL